MRLRTGLISSHATETNHALFNSNLRTFKTLLNKDALRCLNVTKAQHRLLILSQYRQKTATV